MTKIKPTPPNGEFLLYQTEDGRTRVTCRFDHETLWLSQALMAELFQVTPQNITLHLKALYSEGEIDEASTCKEYLQVQVEGERTIQRKIKHFNLDAILAVGFRVRSSRGFLRSSKTSSILQPRARRRQSPVFRERTHALPHTPA